MPLIVFEGIDGCGKTTQIELLKKYFQERLKQPEIVDFVREPGGTKLGEKIRSILLDPETTCTPKVDMFLYMAARLQLLEEKVLPALKKKKLVIMDRYLYSTLAYQVFAGEFQPQEPYCYFAERMPYWAINQTPDRVFYINISVSESLKRREKETGDRIEQRGKQFLEQVYIGYDKAFKWCEKQGHSVIVLDGTQDPEVLHSQILNTIAHLECF